MPNKPVIIANWKMNGSVSLADEVAKELSALSAKDTEKCDIAICPPATLISYLGQVLPTNIFLGSQDCHFVNVPQGAYTGDISASMLKDLGCRYIIIGHSERRLHHHETNAIVRKKVEAAHAAQLVAVVCIGETLAERENGKMYEIIEQQLAGSLGNHITPANTIIAYEPVWAIGTGKTPSIDEISDMHEFIYNIITKRYCNKQDNEFAKNYKLIYGGSVKSDNIHYLLSASYVSGVLVGGASLIASEFGNIIRLA